MQGDMHGNITNESTQKVIHKLLVSNFKIKLSEADL